MEKKERIFSKFNMKDYTNKLEKILEDKKFSLDTKNLLLSMLYKIENGYKDYKKVKIDVISKNEFIEKVLKIIKDDCQEIIVAKFDSEASKVLERNNVQYILDKENGKIIAYGNDLLVLNCILEMQEKQICLPQEKEDLKFSINLFFNLGTKMNYAEVIRDFNGWSWNNVIKEIPNLFINLLFQTLTYLVGNEFIEQWIENKSNLSDYLELLQNYLKKNYGETRANNFIRLFSQIIIDLSILESKEQNKIWNEKRKIIAEELKQLQNKEVYLNKKTKEKKEFTKQIEEIDKILNNKELLKEEYTNRNSKLPNKEKIFSISHLTDRLEEERENLLKNIKACNHLIDPKGYVQRKQIIEEKYEFLNELNIEGKKDIREKLIDICKLFLECFEIKIAREKMKTEIINFIYMLRYYRFLPFDREGTILKEISRLNENFEKCIRLLLEKARSLDVIGYITEDEKANEEIISKIFDSKMIDLDHLIIQTKVENGKLFVEYYDENVLENTVQIQSNRTLKLKKKTKLFI